MDNLLNSLINSESLKLVQEISQFNQEFLIKDNFPRDLYDSLKKTTIITSAGASTRIEGAKLSDQEIISRLEGLKIQRIQDRDEAEVAGYIDCKNYIFENFKDLNFSEHTIRSLHQMMMHYLPHSIMPPNQRGAYKNITNTVIQKDIATGKETVIFETIPPGPQTEVAMQELVTNYNEYTNNNLYSDLEVIAAFIVQFLAIHPFRDGNGRMSRLLTDLCLLKQGYLFCQYASHEKAIEDHKEQYYIALRQTQSTLKDKSDINPWFIFFLKILKRQCDQLKDYLTPIKPGTLTPFENRVFECLQKHKIVTIGFLERELKIKHPTLKKILVRLQEKNMIKMEGFRKGSRYHLI